MNQLSKRQLIAGKSFNSTRQQISHWRLRRIRRWFAVLCTGINTSKKRGRDHRKSKKQRELDNPTQLLKLTYEYGTVVPRGHSLFEGIETLLLWLRLAASPEDWNYQDTDVEEVYRATDRLLVRKHSSCLFLFVVPLIILLPGTTSALEVTCGTDTVSQS